jgi:hypothetical protein
MDWGRAVKKVLWTKTPLHHEGALDGAADEEDSGGGAFVLVMRDGWQVRETKKGQIVGFES